MAHKKQIRQFVKFFGERALEHMKCATCKERITGLDRAVMQRSMSSLKEGHIIRSDSNSRAAGKVNPYKIWIFFCDTVCEEIYVEDGTRKMGNFERQ